MFCHCGATFVTHGCRVGSRQPSEQNAKIQDPAMFRASCRRDTAVTFSQEAVRSAAEQPLAEISPATA